MPCALSAESTCRGRPEVHPLVQIIQRYIEIGATQLTSSGRNQGNNLNFWRIRLQPLEHSLCRVFGRRVTNNEHIDFERTPSAFRGLVVNDRYDFMPDAPKRPFRSVLFGRSANLKHDPLELRFDPNLLARQVGYDIFTG